VDAERHIKDGAAAASDYRRSETDLNHPLAIFHGNESESRALADAVAHYCTCASTRLAGQACPVHTMAAFDQRAVDGLVFVRRTVAPYVRAEWRVTAKA